METKKITPTWAVYPSVSYGETGIWEEEGGVTTTTATVITIFTDVPVNGFYEEFRVDYSLNPTTPKTGQIISAVNMLHKEVKSFLEKLD